MIDPYVPEPEEVLAQVDFAKYYDAAEIAAQQAASFFSERNAEPDPYLYPALFR
mgnify:CR=1 FL=1